jgi:two-component system CheB/CheR fusion protein
MSPRRVLLVEDHESSARPLASLLRQEGYVVSTAQTFSGAFSMIAGQPPVDALVSDIALPDGDGCELLQRLRIYYGGRDIPAVALSALDGAELEDECRRAGYRTFLRKPVKFEQVSAALAALLAAS